LNSFRTSFGTQATKVVVLQICQVDIQRGDDFAALFAFESPFLFQNRADLLAKLEWFVNRVVVMAPVVIAIFEKQKATFAILKTCCLEVADWIAKIRAVAIFNR